MVSFELVTKSNEKTPLDPEYERPSLLELMAKLRPEVTEEAKDAAKEIVSLSVEVYIKGSVCTIIERMSIFSCEEAALEVQKGQNFNKYCRSLHAVPKACM